MAVKVGAPRGGRVHWLLWNLRRDFKGAYQLSFDYVTHNYVFYRMQHRQLYDVFVVVRTSRHCWRCMYSNVNQHIFEYFSTDNSKKMALRMWLLYQKYRGSGE